MLSLAWLPNTGLVWQSKTVGQAVNLADMTELSVSTSSPARTKTDVLVLAVATSDDGPVLLRFDALGKADQAQVREQLSDLGVTGKAGEVQRVSAPKAVDAKVIMTTGVGSVDDDVSHETLREAAGVASRALAGTSSALFALPAGNAVQAQAVAEGIVMGAYQFSTYKEADKAPVGAVTVAVETKDKDVKSAVERGGVIARAVNGARDLVNTSPLQLFPDSFAGKAVAAVKGTKVKAQVWDAKKLEAEGFGGLTGVGRGSSRGPALVKLSYNPSGAKSTIGLVGKGITFDSGGLSLKPPKSMETMKSDMAGAAAVLHTVLAAAELEIPVAVTGWLALAENMPSANAQRPSDVITIKGGKTVEVLNTDAEGRLVLADALIAAQDDKLDGLIDIATLTGAQTVALGLRTSGVMGDDEMRDRVIAAAEVAGEDMWPMPLPAYLAKHLKSPVADLKNIGIREGGMLSAGLFLKEFVNDVPWAHIDIAGPSFNANSPHGYSPKGGTGSGVRTMLETIQAFAE